MRDIYEHEEENHGKVHLYPDNRITLCSEEHIVGDKQPSTTIEEDNHCNDDDHECSPDVLVCEDFIKY